MDYEEFKDQFISAVKESLYEQGSDMNVSVNEVKKLNESYEAMTFTPEGARVGVNIGIGRFYDAYNEGRPFDEVVDKAETRVPTLTTFMRSSPTIIRSTGSLSCYSRRNCLRT